MPGFGHSLSSLPTIFGRLFSLVLPEEMATSLLGVTTFWPFSRGLTFETLAFGRFIGSFPLLVSLHGALYSLLFCESVGEVP